MSGHTNKSFISRSRFISGRGRGSWNKRRPYYFRTSRGANNRSISNIPSVFPQAIGRSSDGLQGSEFFSAPICGDDEKLQVIHISNPVQYPEWRLYFPTEVFTESSPLVCHIRAFEKHVKKYPGVYDLSQIHQQGWFNFSTGFILSDDEFCASWSNFSEDLMVNPYTVLSSLEVGMHRILKSIAIDSSVADDTSSDFDKYTFRKITVPKISARPVDLLPLSSIADITSECFDKLFVVHGRVSCIKGEEIKCSWIAYKCKHCGHEQAIRQVEEYPTKPIRCQIQCTSRRNFIELRSSEYTKIECVQLVQLNEIGLQNQCDSLNIDIEFRRELIDQVFPGLEITVMGVLKLKTFTENGMQQDTKQSIYMQAVSVIKGRPRHISQKNNEVIQMITMEKNCLQLLIRSIAPEMCGNEMVKLAILLSLFGGSGSQVHEEGEVNVLVVGNPGLGKSNLLKNAAYASDRGTLVSVKTKSIFMPTCQNPKSSIVSGSIMMSDTGHCCIDDMDKLSQNQEILIHAMQTKSITLRNHCIAFNLKTKPTIIAGVNPAGGHYDSSKLLRENVQLSPAFLSLFHTIFVIYDKADKNQDTSLTEHVKALHSGMKQILSMPTKYSMKLKPSDDSTYSEELDIEDHRNDVDAEEKLDLLPAVLLKKYIEYARQNIKPLLSEEAASKIKQYYMELRSEKNEKQLFSITTRQLEGLILLTQARARTEMCFQGTKAHARDIIKLSRASNTSFGDQLNMGSTVNEAGTSQRSQIKKMIHMLQVRSNALGRTVFTNEELKDMALHSGIKCSVENLIDILNLQGFLLKKGSDLFKFVSQ